MIPAPPDGSPTVAYRKSSFCAGGACVEVATLPDEEIALRDGKDDSSPVLRFTPEEWDAFVAGVLDGQFSRDALRQYATDA